MDPRLRTLAALPFLKDQYLEASTFNRDGVTKDEAASKLLAEFPDEDAFVVRLLDELYLDDDALRAKHKFMVTCPDGKQERDRRYAAAGEYVAAYSDILIALTDKRIGQAETAMLDSNKNLGASGLETACPAWPVFRAFTAVSYVTGAPVSCDEAYLNRLPKADAIVLNLWLLAT